MQNVFYRKADFLSGGQGELDDSSISGGIGGFIQDYFGGKATLRKSGIEGTYHHVYHILFGSQEYFLKISKFEELKNTLFLESYVYSNLLKPLGIGLEVIALDLGCKTYPFPFILLSKAQGTCLRTVELDSAFFPAIIEDLGRVMACYHHSAVHPTGYGLIDANALAERGRVQGQCPTWEEYFYLNWQAHLRFAEMNRAFDREEREWIESIFMRHQAFVRQERSACFLHGDMGSHNIFFDPSTSAVTSIIDWEDVLLGDPVFDIAMFASFYRMHEFLAPFLKGYQSVQRIADDSFDLRYWLYYLRIALTKSVVRFRLGYDRAGRSLATSKIKMAVERLKTYG